MLRTTGWLLLASLASVTACTQGASPPPLQPTDALAPDLSVQASGCATPKFTVVLVPTSGLSFNGVLSGDLEGTVTLLFDPGSFKFAGVTFANSGTAHWEISGGVLPGLGAFDTEFNNRNLLVDRPGSPATLFENIGTHRAAGGVDKANLTYKGTFTVMPTQEAIHEYQGVVCL
jgi:hypothetical protein